MAGSYSPESNLSPTMSRLTRSHRLAAWRGQNGMPDFVRDFPACPLYTRMGPDARCFIEPHSTGFRITLGDYSPLALPSLAGRGLINLGRAIVRHEVAHARFTDFASYRGLCRDFGQPRANLFEDVRIEAWEKDRWARVLGMPGAKPPRAWGWSRMLTPPAQYDTPEQAILGQKCHFVGIPYTGAPTTATGKSAISVIRDAFRRATAAATTEALRPILEEWAKEFPGGGSGPVGGPLGEMTGGDNPGEGEGKGPGGGDASGPGKMPGTGGEKTGTPEPGAAAPDPADADSPVPPGKPPEGKTTTPGEPTDGESGGGYGTKCDEWGPFRPGQFSRRAVPSGGVERDLISRLRAIAAGMLARVPTLAEVGESGSRPYVPAIAAGLPGFIRIGAGPDKPRLVILCDMSGSMASDWAGGGMRELAMALMSTPGIECRGFLTGDGKCQVIPTAEELTRYEAGGGCESVPQSLDLLERHGHLAWADVILVLTDGHLTDGAPGDRWRRRGIDLIGAVCTPDPDRQTYAQEQLAEHFTRGIVAETPAQLLRAVVGYTTRYAR